MIMITSSQPSMLHQTARRWHSTARRAPFSSWRPAQSLPVSRAKTTGHNMSPSDDGEETLAALIELSRTPEGREGLTDVLIDTLFLLPASPPRLLLLRLRLLRNLLAGDELNHYAFIEHSGPAAVSASVLSFPSLAPDVARAALQALGNAALAGELHRDAVWQALFPEALRVFAGLRDQGVLDPLCMVLDTCCGGEGGRGRLQELCHEELGLPILVQTVTTASQGEMSSVLYYCLLV